MKKKKILIKRKYNTGMNMEPTKKNTLNTSPLIVNKNKENIDKNNFLNSETYIKSNTGDSWGPDGGWGKNAQPLSDSQLAMGFSQDENDWGEDGGWATDAQGLSEEELRMGRLSYTPASVIIKSLPKDRTHAINTINNAIQSINTAKLKLKGEDLQEANQEIQLLKNKLNTL